MIARRFAIAAFVWCVLFGAVLLFAPVYRTSSCSATSDSPTSVCTTSSKTLVEANGPGVAAVLAIPAVVTGVPLVFRRRAVAIAGAIVLTALTFLGAASIGLPLVPAVGLAWCAAVTRPSPQPRPVAT